MTLTNMSLVTLAPPIMTGVAYGVAYGEEDVSPVTLDAHWNKVGRLLLLAAMAVIGSVGNVFFISSILIEDFLKQRGNAFLVNVALADLLVTGLVFPASAVVILAGLRDTQTACSFHWIVAVLSVLVTLLTYSAIAVENLMRLCLPPSWYEHVTPCKITSLVFLIWIVSGSVVGVQTALPLGPDYCHRKFPGLVPYQMAVMVVLVAVPLLVTLLCFIVILVRVHSAKLPPSYKPPITFSWDFSLMKTNFLSFFCFVIFWMPFGMVLEVQSINTVSPRVLYHLAWFALSKSCLNNYLYCVTNRHFRNAYVNLFHYCCCKTTVALSRRPRPEASRPTGDVRVHIIPGYNMYSYTSPQRAERNAASAAKPTAKRPPRPPGGRGNGREVYEL
ncbi:hypothetical protein FOCC_FOCC004021 [Frankliniella occidentalis]|uniref:Melatonin receptor type 1A-like n=1 Tax=Frankliniella occidentalis TaxID=133901 RepID=A0A6J1T4U1_FRAOC|nr:melatonin receptor type 1A-like [Frankliniella occidentalis]XP_052121353.1 melatonin receptor type 1A-like [Frankliniella occidentalis]KAE8749314.1 hypothetical protein FOCC_FOCC004021 [Frankliniella occidentalis]